MLAGAGAALSVTACTDGPGIEPVTYVGLSRAFCEKAVECGCAPLLGDIGFVPPLSCEGWNFADLLPDEGGYDEYGDGYGDRGEYGYGDDSGGGTITITFDEDCANRLGEALAATSCDLRIPEIACEQSCKLYFGTRFEGEACGNSIECGQGLTCSNGECRDPCKLQVAGEGESCELAVCAEGLSCEDPVEGGGAPTCVDAEEGEFCDGQNCSPNSYCDTNDPNGPSCRPRGGIGAECMGHSQCETSYCPAGYCELLPGNGQACTNQGQCSEEATCLRSEADPIGTCTEFAPLCELLFEIPSLAGD